MGELDQQFQVDVDGGSLAAFRSGASAPAVIAVHGITATSRTWNAVMRKLDGSVELIALDLRGRGASHEVSGPYGIDVHVQDVLAVLDRLSISQAVLAGHSLGAYIVARLAVRHPDRVRSVVLVDGGLPIPGAERIDPHAAADALLGRTLARIALRFASREEYYAWWHQHPAFANSDIAEQDLRAYADHDLTGAEPELRSSIVEQAIREDSLSLFTLGASGNELTVPAWMVFATRGLQDEPSPLQPLEVVQEWAAARPAERQPHLVEDSNHYTVVLGDRGARAVAEAMRGAVLVQPS